MATFKLVNGMNDLRLKPRFLRSLLQDILPDDKRPFPTPSELSYLLSHVRALDLLSERVPNPESDLKLVEAWKSAVDEWLDRLLSLVSNDMPDKCWAGICLLGMTCESSSSDRFLASYSVWFEKLLSNFQQPSSTLFVKVACCASLTDLFTRLACYSNLKKDATSFGGKLVHPILQVLDVDDAEAAWGGAVDLLCTLMTLFPSSLHRHYDNVEAVLVSKIMSAKSNSDLVKKCVFSLALLPKVKGDEESWSLLMQKILIAIHVLLNDAFQGLEEEAKCHEIMRLLVPPGKDPPPPLGGHLMSESSEQATKKFREVLMPRASNLMHCCSVMLTNSYPVQTAVPIHQLLALIRRVLLVDGSLQEFSSPYVTALHQELLCADLPTLHLNSLDVLIAVIKGTRSQLLPHAANIVRLLTEYFSRAILPSIRIKLYSVMQILLISMGVGIALYLAPEVINNAFADLSDYHECGSLSSKMNLPKSASETLDRVYNRKRKHTFGSLMQQPNGVSALSDALHKKWPAPISVKIAALRALEALLTVGGSLRSESWRPNVDSLLINVARSAFHTSWVNEGKYPNLNESPISKEDFQLAALEALLASLLSPAPVRPPYLSQGFELFRKGKQETGTRIAAFCARALLSLEILIHPRALPLINAPATKSTEFNTDFNVQHQKMNSPSILKRDPKTANGVDDDNDDLFNSWFGNNEPARDDDINATKNTENQEHSLMDFTEKPLAEKNLVDQQESGREANIETCKEPNLGVTAEFSKEDDSFTRTAVSMDICEPSNTRAERGKDVVDSSNISGLQRDTSIGSESLDRDLDSNTNIGSGNFGVGLDRDASVGSQSLGEGLNRDTGTGSERLGISGIMMQSNDSDSDTSIESLPDIVDVGPDTDSDSY